MASGPAFVNITFTLPNDPTRYPAGATNAAGEKIGGRITGSGNRFKRLYRELADELQDNVAETILAERQVREKNPRKPDSKGTLARITRQSGNQNATNGGFSVGSHTHLSNSVAKYYRIIEEGSQVAAPAYPTTMISGWWRGDEPTGYIRPFPPERQPALMRKRRHIKPLLAYSRAWTDINASGRLRQMWRQILVDSGLVSPRGGPLPKRFEIGNINY